MADAAKLRVVVRTRLVTPERHVAPGDAVELPAAEARLLASVGAVEIAPAPTPEAPPAGNPEGGKSLESAPEEPAQTAESAQDEPAQAPARPARASRTTRA